MGRDNSRGASVPKDTSSLEIISLEKKWKGGLREVSDRVEGNRFLQEGGASGCKEKVKPLLDIRFHRVSSSGSLIL